MITLIHGDNGVASQAFLQDLVASAKKSGRTVIVLAKEDQKASGLSQVLHPKGLFGDTTVILEDFLKQKNVTKDSSETKLLNSTTVDLVLWEDNLRSKTALSLFPKAKVFEFKSSTLLFRFLDALRPSQATLNLNLFRGTLVTDPPEMVFTMLAKRLCDLVYPADSLAPWQKSKLLAQKKLFPPDKLKKAVGDLTQIDLAQKSSGSPFNLSAEIELFLARL